MTWRRPKFTTRRMMTAVAVVAVALGSVRWYRWAMARHVVYQRIAIIHEIKGNRCREEWTNCPHGEVFPSRPDLRKAAFHEAMARKYSAAANFPWFHVCPTRRSPEDT
jgi:hypothetical protein